MYVNWVYIIPLKQKKKHESKRMEEQFPSTKWQIEIEKKQIRTHKIIIEEADFIENVCEKAE